MSARILIADDDKAIRIVLSQALIDLGHAPRVADNAATLWQWIKQGDGDLVITDVVMPDADGIDLIPKIKKIRPDLPIIVMSAQNTLLTAIRATKHGAFEYLPKPFDLRALALIIERALIHAGAKKTADVHAGRESGDLSQNLPFIGRSNAMQEVYRTMARLINTDTTVLIQGESGTGKELIARSLHDFSARSRHPFVAINMAAVPQGLIESELFGHAKGAFTGASDQTIGRFEQADGGTLFLDEIGDMPIETQTRLLRVLQTGEFSPVGARKMLKVNVRIIAATHRDLWQDTQRGGFREDLFYRLNVVPIYLPPLRDRTEDIPDLAHHFLAKAAHAGAPVKSLAAEAIAALQAYPWPGNVRELENLMQRITILYSETTIGRDLVENILSKTYKNIGRQSDDKIVQPQAMAEDNGQAETLGKSVERHLRAYFDAHFGTLPAKGLYDRVIQEVDKPLIEVALMATHGNQIKAADLLGINRNTLRKKIRMLGIHVAKLGRQ